jgi:hypothetical protein
VINLQDPSMLAAARGQVKSLRWRLIVGALFAIGAALVLESAAAGLGWYLVLALSMCFDYMLGNSYLEQRGQADRKTAGVLFVWGSAVHGDDLCGDAGGAGRAGRRVGPCAGRFDRGKFAGERDDVHVPSAALHVFSGGAADSRADGDAAYSVWRR